MGQLIDIKLENTWGGCLRATCGYTTGRGRSVFRAELTAGEICKGELGIVTLELSPRGQGRNNELCVRKNQHVYMRELVWKHECKQSRRETLGQEISLASGQEEWCKRPIPDSLVATFRQDWTPVLLSIINTDKGGIHCV